MTMAKNVMLYSGRDWLPNWNTTPCSGQTQLGRIFRESSSLHSSEGVNAANSETLNVAAGEALGFECGMSRCGLLAKQTSQGEHHAA